jgi:hydroxymethylpyrimidine pyrophosphatase-like HAD family hydrolase
MVACPVSSHTLHRFAVARDLVTQTAQCLLRHRHPVLILKDPLEAGYDYLVIVGPERLPLDPVTLWWFNSMNVRVRYAAHLEDDDHPEHTVRIGACGLSGALARIKSELSECLGDRAVVHHFPAVVSRDLAPKNDDGQTLHVLEVFDPGATKWSAVSHLARTLAIAPEHVAAIGDEINDVSMLSHAGLGIAMANAVPDARAAARRHTLSNDEHGVAHAIDRILQGAW